MYFLIVKAVLTQIEVLEEQVRSICSQQCDCITNTLKISAMQVVTDMFLVTLSKDLKTALPSVDFDFKIQKTLSPVNLPDLNDADCFIGLNVENTFDDALENIDNEVVNIFSGDFYAVMSKKHSLAVKRILDIVDVIDYKLVLHDYDANEDDFYELILPKSKHGEHFSVALRSNNSRVINSFLQTTDAILITNNIIAFNDYAFIEELVVLPIRNIKYQCFVLYEKNSSQKFLIEQV